MAINGQVGNPTNLSDQEGSSVLSFEELGHGQANNYLPGGNKGKFLISKYTPSNVSSLSIQSGFDLCSVMQISFIGMIPAVDGNSLYIQFYENGVLEDAAVYNFGLSTTVSDGADTSSANTSQTNIAVFPVGPGNSALEMGMSEMMLFMANKSDRQTNCYFNSTLLDSSGNTRDYLIVGELPQASKVDGIKIFFSGGNITSGIVKVYGYE
jgi:hypothetical protein